MSAVKLDVMSDTTGQWGVDAQTSSLLDKFDGTAETYKKVMHDWFLMRGCNALTPTGLTALVDEWYEITRNARWVGWTEFYQPDVSAVTYGTKGGDNELLTCTPSTDTVANQDDYAGLPLFACVDCNWTMVVDTTDSDGNAVEEAVLRPVITAIDGISTGFKRTDPTKYVGVLQMAGYVFQKSDDSTYTIGYASNRDIPYANVEPLAEAVNPDDGTVRSWVLHTKYANSTYNSLMTSCKGLIPTGFLSHNTIHTLSKVNGSQYSGTCACDISWLQLMMMIKYGSLTLDGILQGCCNNNYQYPVSVGETGVRRVLLTTTQAANLEVGMGVLIGDYTSSGSDRAYLYSITGTAGAIITKIETVTVDEVEYSAIYVDTDDTFDTTANGSATVGTTYISTYAWPTGTTDGVLGNDGSPVSCTSGKYPAKLQGIEFMNGQYEVVADTILSLYQDDDDEAYYYEPYLCDTSANQSTALTTNYEASGLKIEQPSSEGWKYIKKLARKKGIFFAEEVGGSSSTYTRDAFYMNVSGTSGTRAWYAFGFLALGVACAGVSCVSGYIALSSSAWIRSSRLSPNGNRGEWVA